MDKPGGAFEQNVFVNCPYDNAYQPLMRALLFTIVHCGFVPRLASERADSGEVRVSKIVELLKECQFSIHDLSRARFSRESDTPRFNMPFELGIDLGLRAAGRGRLTQKRCLILEEESFRYHVVLSDLSGNDTRAHHGDPETLVRHVRNWLLSAKDAVLSSPTLVWERYNEFCFEFDAEMKRRRYVADDIAQMPVIEYNPYFVLGSNALLHFSVLY